MMTTTTWPDLDGVALVGLGHKARQGKDMLTDALLNHYGNSRRLGFADAVKVLARADYGMTTKDGPLLQRLGMEGRAHDPDTWVRIVAWTIHEWLESAPEGLLVVIPDLRFPNEAAFIRAYGGICVDVRRWHADGSRVITTDRDAGHASETSLNGFTFDAIIDNIEARQDEARDRLIRLVDRAFDPDRARRRFQ
jgi:hypothetical protein